MPHWATSLHTCYGPSRPSPNNNGNGPRFPPDPVGVGGLALWHGHPERRCRPSSVVHASGPASPASKCTFHHHYICLSVPNQNGRDGVGEMATNLPCPVSRSQSSTSMNYACPWKLYMLPGMCTVCAAMRCMYAIQYVRQTAQLVAVDIKALADVDTTSHCILPHPCWF